MMVRKTAAALSVLALCACTAARGQAPEAEEKMPAAAPAAEPGAILPPPELQTPVEGEASSPAPGSAPAANAAPPAPRAVEPSVSAEDIFQAVEKLTTLTADFSLARSDGYVASGKLYLRRPGRIRFEYDEPATDLIIADGTWVTVIDTELDNPGDYPNRYRIRQTPLRFLLDETVDRDGFEILNLEQIEDVVAFTVSSRDEETAGDMTLLFDADTLDMLAWTVTDAQGLRTDFTLSGVEKGKRLRNRLFQVDVEGGAFLKND